MTSINKEIKSYIQPFLTFLANYIELQIKKKKANVNNEKNRITGSILLSAFEALQNVYLMNSQLNLIMHIIKLYLELTAELTPFEAEVYILKDFYKKEIENKLTYSEFHPLVGYDPFFESLLQYYKKHENYEKCKEILDVNSNLRGFYEFIDSPDNQFEDNMV